MGAIKLVTVGLDFDFYKTVRGVAKSADISMSEFIRRCIGAGVKRAARQGKEGQTAQHD